MNKVIISKRFTTYLSGGISLTITKSEGTHESISISADWANGESMEYLNELTLNNSDMAQLAELFEHVNKEMNS
jgi:hypothetical protein